MGGCIFWRRPDRWSPLLRSLEDRQRHRHWTLIFKTISFYTFALIYRFNSHWYRRRFRLMSLRNTTNMHRRNNWIKSVRGTQSESSGIAVQRKSKRWRWTSAEPVSSATAHNARNMWAEAWPPPDRVCNSSELDWGLFRFSNFALMKIRAGSRTEELPPTALKGKIKIDQSLFIWTKMQGSFCIRRF